MKPWSINEFITGEHPNKDLWDGEGSCSWPQVHWGVCSADRGGLWWLQACHREEHSPSSSCREHSADIWCQHQTQPKPTSAYKCLKMNLWHVLFCKTWKPCRCLRFCPTQSSSQRELRSGTWKSQTASWLVEMKQLKVKGQLEHCVLSMNIGSPKNESSRPTHGRQNFPNW